MSAARERSIGELEELALCERARLLPRRKAGCSLPFCSREAGRDGVCAHHADMAREDPTPAEMAKLDRWGWRRCSITAWTDSQCKYSLHWRQALARIAADEARGDLPEVDA